MNYVKNVSHFLFVSLFVFSIAACKGGGSSASSGSSGVSTEQAAWWRKPKASPTPAPTPVPSTSTSPTPVPSTSATPTPTPAPTGARKALIYNGPGATATGVDAIKSILTQNGVAYATADAAGFNNMSLSTMASYNLIIFPGGDSNPMNDNLTDAARLRVKQAVINYGVSYTGFCAGAWMAVGPTQAVSATPYWGFGIIPGAYLKQYYPNGTNPESAMLTISIAGSGTRQLVWYRGPILPSLSGGIVARYPDGTPAFVEAWAGKGSVTLTGPHPEAPQSWRYGLNDSDGLDYDVAWKVIQAALEKRALLAF